MSRESATPFGSPLSLELHFSRYFLAGLGFIFLLTLFSIWYASIGWILQLFLTLLSTVYFIYCLHSQNKIKSVTWLKDNQWQLVLKNKKIVDASLTPKSFMGSWLIILVLKTESGQYFSTVLLPDSISKEKRRQLRVRLSMITASTFEQDDQTAF